MVLVVRELRMCVFLSVMCFIYDWLGRTCDLVQALPGHMVILVDPLSVALEVDLGGRSSSASELDWAVLHYEGILRLQLELWERFCWGRGERVWEDLTVVTAL